MTQSNGRATFGEGAKRAPLREVSAAQYVSTLKLPHSHALICRMGEHEEASPEVSGEIRFDFAKKSKQSCISNRAKKP